MKREYRSRVSPKVVIAALLVAVALCALMISWNVGHPPSLTGSASALSTLSTNVQARAKQLIGKDGLAPSERTSQRVYGIVRGADGEPLAGATVCASCADCDLNLMANAPRCVTTDSNGRYAMDGLPAGEYLVSMSAAGHAPALATESKVLSIGKPEGPPEIELNGKLEEGGALVTGVVMDAFGGVVAHATVQAISVSADYPSSNGTLAQSAQGDEEGRFALTTPAGPLRLMASAEGYAPASADRVAPCSDVELVMTPASRIRGRVLTAQQSAPIGGVRVMAKGPIWSRQQATTDEAGQFEITGLRPGVYSLRATGDRWIGQSPAPVTVDLIDVVDDVVVLVQSGVTVEGALLLAADEAPCTNGAVRLGAPPGTHSVPTLDERPNSEGKVVFEAVPAGSYRVSAYCNGLGSQAFGQLEVGQEDLLGIRWLFQPRLSIQGRAVDATGKPVSKLTLFLVSQTQLAMGPRRPATVAHAFVTESDGSFTMGGLSEGHYKVEGDLLKAPVEVELSAANSPFNLEVVVNPVGEIAVEVLTPQGKPVDGLTVHATVEVAQPSPSSGSIHQATPLGGGKYQLGPLAVGSYAVYVSDSTNPVVRAGGPSNSVQVLPGETTSVKVALNARDGRIAGQVLDDAGAPLERIFVSAIAKGFDENALADFEREKRIQESLERITDSEGRFLLDGLAGDGVFTLIARRASGSQKLVGNVKPGADVTIVLPTTGRLSGTAVSADGAPVQQFSIVVANSETKEQRSEAFADPGGRWAFEDVAPGPILISGHANIGDQGSVELVLAPKETRSEIRLVLGSAAPSDP